MKRIAILDDDAVQCDFISQTLTEFGHACHVFMKGADLVQHLYRETFDLLMLDWVLPDMDGVEVLHWMQQRTHMQVPVIFITARNDEGSIAQILNSGVDDYIVKPVSAQVLLARVNALLRRLYAGGKLSSKKAFGAYLFDQSRNCITVKGRAVSLTQKEFELALLLFQHLGQPLSRAHILDMIWKRADKFTSRTMDTHISTLRSKLGLRAENGYRLVPIYGHGYRLERIEDVIS